MQQLTLTEILKITNDPPTGVMAVALEDESPLHWRSMTPDEIISELRDLMAPYKQPPPEYDPYNPYSPQNMEWDHGGDIPRFQLPIGFGFPGITVV